LNAAGINVNGNVRVGNAVLAQPSGTAPLYTARAWVNAFNNSATNSMDVFESGNVSSVTRLTSSRFRVNFSQALPTKYYSAVASYTYRAASGEYFGFVQFDPINSQTMSSCTFNTIQLNGAPAIPEHIMFMAIH